MGKMNESPPYSTSCGKPRDNPDFLFKPLWVKGYLDGSIALGCVFADNLLHRVEHVEQFRPNPILLVDQVFNFFGFIRIENHSASQVHLGVGGNLAAPVANGKRDPSIIADAANLVGLNMGGECVTTVKGHNPNRCCHG